MKYTKEDVKALENCITMWEILSKDFIRGKSGALEKMDIDPHSVENKCFLCQRALEASGTPANYCIECLLKDYWAPGKEGLSLNFGVRYGYCEIEPSPYYKWASSDSYEDKQEYATKIVELTRTVLSIAKKSLEKES